MYSLYGPGLRYCPNTATCKVAVMAEREARSLTATAAGCSMRQYRKLRVPNVAGCFRTKQPDVSNTDYNIRNQKTRYRQSNFFLIFIINQGKPYHIISAIKFLL